jgi:hypothetical protein
MQIAMILLDEFNLPVLRSAGSSWVVLVFPDKLSDMASYFSVCFHEHIFVGYHL